MDRMNVSEFRQMLASGQLTPGKDRFISKASGEGNRKIKNATKVEQDGEKFDSNLEYQKVHPARCISS